MHVELGPERMSCAVQGFGLQHEAGFSNLATASADVLQGWAES